MPKKIKILITLAIVLVVGAGIFAAIKFVPTNVAIPAELTQKNEENKLIAYLPGWLPGTYQINRESFEIQEGKVFLFSATDKDRNRLFFSQQPIPKDFDFERFYNTQVIQPSKLENVPFESVYAKSLFGKTWILSIVTDTTWIMMTTESPIDTVMAEKIVQEMKLY